MYDGWKSKVGDGRWGEKVNDRLLLCLAGTPAQGQKTATNTIVHPQSIQLCTPQLT